MQRVGKRTVIVVCFSVLLLATAAIAAGCAASAPSSPSSTSSEPAPVLTTTHVPPPIMSAVSADPFPGSSADTFSDSTTSSSTTVPALFKSSVSEIDTPLELQLLMTGVYRPDGPVPLSELRLIEVTYWGFDGAPHYGHLIVNQAWGTRLCGVFKKLFAAHFRIRRMDPIDWSGMLQQGLSAADNTASFYGRLMRGGTDWSMHAYGLAVDINAAENPSVKRDSITPAEGAPYTDRSLDMPGMIHPGDVAVRAFAAIGWKWGGDWKSFKDYMHFSANGR